MNTLEWTKEQTVVGPMWTTKTTRFGNTIHIARMPYTRTYRIWMPLAERISRSFSKVTAAMAYAQNISDCEH